MSKGGKMTYPTEEEYREAYEKWCQEHPGKTGAEISQNAVVEINGKLVKLGKKINYMRNFPNNLSPTVREYWQKTNALETQEERLENKYRQAALLWKKENHKEHLDIPITTTVYIKRYGMVKIGRHLSDMRSIYKMQKKGSHYHGRKNLTEEQIAWWTKEGMNWERPRHSKTRRQAPDHHLELVQELKSLRDEENELDNILDWLLIDYETFRQIVEEKINKIKINEDLKSNQSEILTDHSSCCQLLLEKVIKFHRLFPNESLEQILTRSIHEITIEKEFPNWIMEKYTPYVIEILQYLNLPVREITNLMNQDILPLEQAIIIQLVGNQNISPKDKKWLQITTEYLVNLLLKHSTNKKEEIIDNFFDELKEHQLTKQELKKLRDLSLQAFERIRMFQILEVGLETEEKKKLEKMKAYHFSSQDIEEAYFNALRFNRAKKSKQEKNNDRLELLRQYIIDWRLYSPEEKRRIIENHHFTEEEISYMNTTRQKIDHTIYKVKKTRKKS